MAPVRPTRADEVGAKPADEVRAKLAERGLTDADVREAVAWARRADKEGAR